MRALASVRKIADLQPIEGADAIECAVVGGWKVVVKKNEFSPGMRAVYCEIDSWIPTKLAPFLSKGKEPREYEGVKGERLRTVKLRGQLSQGLLLNLDVVLPFTNSFQIGDDVSETLNIKKWEAVISAQLAGQVKGNFPACIPKTDQERVQNLVQEIAFCQNNTFEVTEKLEGSSMTCYLIDGEFGVCSRNLDLKRDENNSFWKIAIEQDIEGKMREVGDNFALQGELVGPGVQGNIYKLNKLDFFVFDLYDIKVGQYLSPAERRGELEMMGLNQVPVIKESFVLIGDVECLINYAEGSSMLYDKQEREGVVFKHLGNGITFKAISNKYLLKSGE
jgi:RNA ligase (TIGR02306 family)